MAGCGGGSLDAPSGTITDGSELSPRRYLADTVSGAAVLREFNRALEALGPRPTPDQVRAAVPALDEAHARAELVAERLERARLADARLETQRGEAAAAYGVVVAAMDAVVEEARAGRPVRLATAVAEYQEAVDALERDLGAPPG